jgi:ABC transporter, phosphonate, periplasmic substrate-binding protein
VNPRTIIAIAASGLAQLLAPVVQGAEGVRATPDGVLRVAVSHGTISALSEREARLALKVYFKQLAADWGLVLEARDVADDAALRAAMRQSVPQNLEIGPDRVDIFLATGDTFTRMRQESALRPLLIKTDKLAAPNRHGGTEGAEPLVLLTPKRGQISGSRLVDLRGARLIVDTGGWGGLPLLWLDERLAAFQSHHNQFFGSITEVNRSGRAILQVFYHHADACIVPERAFEAEKAENPQLGEALQFTEISKPLTQAVLGLSEALAQAAPQMGDQIIQDMTSNVKARAMIELLGGQMVPFGELAVMETLALTATMDAQLTTLTLNSMGPPAPVASAPTANSTVATTTQSPRRSATLGKTGPPLTHPRPDQRRRATPTDE